MRVVRALMLGVSQKKIFGHVSGFSSVCERIQICFSALSDYDLFAALFVFFVVVSIFVGFWVFFPNIDANQT